MVIDGECDLENLTNGEYCYNDVYQDKGYMASVGSWAIGDGTGVYELTYGEDYEYVPVPQYGEQMAFASETGWGLMVPANSANVDAAWDFVKFFSEPENLVQHNIACSQLPPRKSLLENEEYREAMPNIGFVLDSPIGSSAEALQALAPGAHWLAGQRFSADASQDTLSAWVEGLPLE